MILVSSFMKPVFTDDIKRKWADMKKHDMCSIKM